MSRIAIVTDSTADIPSSVSLEHGIHVVPLKVHFGTETYEDTVTINAQTFYSKLVEAKELPTTSQPSPVDFMEVYKKIAAEQPDTEIISIHISSALSGTYQSAILAKSLLEEENINVTVIDSKTTSYALGMLAVSAAKAAEEGKSSEEIVELIKQISDSTRIYFIVDTLEYLQKGGRIGKASALFGSLLNIKPILTVDKSGEVAPLDKVRGQKKAFSRMIELLDQDFNDKPMNLYLAHSEALEAATELSDIIKEKFTVVNHMYVNLGAVIGTHTGPGVVAIIAHQA